MSGWDREVDVAIVGSGAGAMTAALVAAEAGAECLVLEKTALYGGSSALSGGAVWAPRWGQWASRTQARPDSVRKRTRSRPKYFRGVTAPASSSAV